MELRGSKSNSRMLRSVMALTHRNLREAPLPPFRFCRGGPQKEGLNFGTSFLWFSFVARVPSAKKRHQSVDEDVMVFWSTHFHLQREKVRLVHRIEAWSDWKGENEIASGKEEIDLQDRGSAIGPLTFVFPSTTTTTLSHRWQKEK